MERNEILLPTSSPPTWKSRGGSTESARVPGNLFGPSTPWGGSLG